MLDTHSLCHCAATCSMFNNCAMDPLCYSDINLITSAPKVNNSVVSTMIQRAGKNLRSLKLGIWPCPTMSTDNSRLLPYSARTSIHASGPSWNEKRPRIRRESSVLTRSCLLALSVDGGAAGALLRRLHLYNIDKMDNSSLGTALSACQFLLDLGIIGLHIELKRTINLVGSHCHLIQRIFFESTETGRDDSLKSSACEALVNGCPNLVSLALRGFRLQDVNIHILVKGLRKLKAVDFATSYLITGAFLRNLGDDEQNPCLLEVLILRDCLHLKEAEVAHFLSSLLTGDCRNLRYLDISNKDGLSAERDWNGNVRCFNPRIPVAQVMKERPNLCLRACFPSEATQASLAFPLGDSGLQISNVELIMCSGSSNSSSSSFGSEDDDDDIIWED